MKQKFTFLGLSFRIIKNKDNYDLYCHEVYLYSSGESMEKSFKKNCKDKNITHDDILNYISIKRGKRFTIKK